MRIEISRARQLRGEFNCIIEIVVLLDLLVRLHVKKFLCSQISELSQIKLSHAWRLMLVLKLFDALKVCVLLGTEVHLV